MSAHVFLALCEAKSCCLRIGFIFIKQEGFCLCGSSFGLFIHPARFMFSLLCESTWITCTEQVLENNTVL